MNKPVGRGGAVGQDVGVGVGTPESLPYAVTLLAAAPGQVNELVGKSGADG